MKKINCSTALTTIIAISGLLLTPAQAQERVKSLAGSPPPQNVSGGDIPPPPDRQIEYSPYPEVDYPDQVFFGDTHLHTAYSADAGLAMATTTPDDAFRFAKGETVTSSQGLRARLQRPYDFLVVTDHAENLGVAIALEEKDPVLQEIEWGKDLQQRFGGGSLDERASAYELWFGTVNTPGAEDPTAETEMGSDMWKRMTQAAEDHNDPGQFTAFIGFEWTSGPDGNNLHRNIIFRDGKDIADQIGQPFSAYDSDDPEEFWTWMEGVQRRTGAQIFAIPHNGNLSNGLMFDDVTLSGDPLTRAYAERRQKWEPIYEVTQIKGDSETHPLQSPNDEFADFATYDHLLDAAAAARGEAVRQVVKEGDYARRALRVGLDLEQSLGVNPFKFGLIGSTDSHSTMASAEENNFWGKFALDSTPSARTVGTLPGTENMFGMSAAGLAAVWAEENTRASIFEAFQRKEVYATSGPRIALRFFGGFDFIDADASSRELAKVGYARGVPMGGALTAAPAGQAPGFLIHAVKDPKEANLDRVQVVKGWLGSDGETHEKIYDVAWSGNRQIGADGKLPAVGSTVNLDTGTYTNDIGTAELAKVWHDPDFDPDQRAFYYVRVLQIPTPRYSLLDAIALQIDNAETGQVASIQERAYSSPIWYTP